MIKNRRFVILFIDYLIMLTGFYLVISVFHGYITGELGFTAELAGVILGIFSFAAMLMRPFCGLLSERVNHTRLLRLSVLSLIISGVIYLISSSSAVILLARILNGAGFALAGTIMVVQVYRSIPKEKAGSAIGIFGLTNVIASSVGPFLGTKILAAYGYKGVFISSLIVYGIMFGCIPRCEDEAAGTVRKLSLQSFFVPKVIPYACMGGVFSFISAILSSYIISFGRELGEIDLSLFFTINAVAVFLIRLIGGRLYDKKGIFAAGPPTMAVTALALLAIGYAERLSPGTPETVVFICGVFLAVGQGIAWPALQTMSLQAVDRSKSGAASGTYSFGADIGQMLGPVFAGFVLGRFIGVRGYFNMFIFSGIVMTAATVLFTVFMIIHAKKSKTGGEEKRFPLKPGNKMGGLA